METENQRQVMPVDFEDYIAQTFGYDTLLRVPRSKLKEVKAHARERFAQMQVRLRTIQSVTPVIFRRKRDESALQFCQRVDKAIIDYATGHRTETRISGTVPGDTVITGCPFDEQLPPIPGDAETLGLSDLKPETVKLVAAELLAQEKRALSHKRLIDAAMCNGITWENLKEKFAETAKVLQDFNNALFLHTLAKRYGQSILNAIPKKRTFSKGGITFEEDSFRVWVPKIGPEQIVDRLGKTRNAPELKIETNQQWSPEELKNWLKAQPGNTKQERKPYFNPDLNRPYREPVMTATSNDGLTRFDEIKIRNYTPDNWPVDAPPYFSAEGWEFEKAMKLRNLKSMLTIEWLEKQQTEKHALVAKRLREILAV